MHHLQITSFTCHGVWTLVFPSWHERRNSDDLWFMIYVCLLPLHQFMLSFNWFFSLLFIGRELTTIPANNCLQISVAANNIKLMRNWNYALVWKWRVRFPEQAAEWFDIFSWSEERWSNDKTIIELGDRKISWLVSVSQINYLPQTSAPTNNWSARHSQIAIFCSTSSNNC